MIRTLHRVRGASALGARHEGDLGPFGRRPVPGLDEDDDQDEQPRTQTSVRTTDGTATPTRGAANDTTTKENQ